jgi:NADPH:quinone reductase-like Zn-dependent oxidoreductase
VKAAVLHALGELPRFEEIPDPVPAAGEELIEVTAAPLNNIDKVRADGSHYSVKPAAGGGGPGAGTGEPERSTGEPESSTGGSGADSAGGLPAVTGVIGAGRLADGRRVLFGSRLGTMAQYSVVSPEMTFPIPDGLDDALAAAVWNPGLSAWLTLNWRVPLRPGETVLVMGATGVTGKLAVQVARRLGAGRIIAAGRNQQVLGELGADATVDLRQPDDDVAKAFTAAIGDGGCDLVVDYLWGRPTEIFLDALTHHDMQIRSARTRLVQVGEVAGPRISLTAEVLRSAGLEILGVGSGTMPPMDVIMAALAELLALVRDGDLRMDIERVPLSEVERVWPRDQRGCRPVFAP